MTFETITFEMQEGAARLTLNRPDRLNAFNAVMHREVATALSTVEAHPWCRVLLLTGAGRGFCAGQDLAERDVDAGPLDLGAAADAYYNPLVRRLAGLSLPVICAVNGVAAGAGVNLALACDIVVARRSAKFVQAFSAIGLVPDIGGTWSLPHLVGQARALGFTLLRGNLTAEMAESWGLIWKAVDDALFDAEIDQLTKELATAPTRSLAAAKRAIRGAFTSSLNQQLDLERDLQRECGLTKDYIEGVSAFKQKRPARFLGY
jgi:2-(1,2-epoxy-1,2-dihydrophenyl)acetyl-CoA isomerase